MRDGHLSSTDPTKAQVIAIRRDDDDQEKDCNALKNPVRISAASTTLDLVAFTVGDCKGKDRGAHHGGRDPVQGL